MTVTAFAAVTGCVIRHTFQFAERNRVPLLQPVDK
jgi:hypothetical protein